MRAILMALLLVASPPARATDIAGVFDYYVLSLSWSPNWCALEGDASGSDQCTPRHEHGWILHGLWPQHERGWPDYCPTTQRPPSRRMTAAMADIMGSGGLAWHQWRKHGTCTGLSAEDYFAQARAAYAAIARPERFRHLQRPTRLPAAVVEAAFLKANPTLTADGITITCRRGHIQEARICLSRALLPIACSKDIRLDCTLRDAVLMPIR